MGIKFSTLGSRLRRSIPQLHSHKISVTLRAPTLQLCTLSPGLPTHLYSVPTSLPKKLLSFLIFSRKLTLLGSQCQFMIVPPRQPIHLSLPSYTLNGVFRRKGFSIRLHQVLAV